MDARINQLYKIKDLPYGSSGVVSPKWRRVSKGDTVIVLKKELDLISYVVHLSHIKTGDILKLRLKIGTLIGSYSGRELLEEI